MLQSSSLKNKRHVIFDFDGTIAKINLDWSIWHKNVRMILAEYEPNLAIEGSVNNFINIMVEKHGVHLRDKIVEYNESFECEYNKGVVTNTLVLEYLRNEKSKNFYLLTSNSRRFIDQVLVELGLEHIFDLVITRNDVFYTKPHTEGISRIVEKGKEGDYIMIGDSSSDEGAAKNIGIEYIFEKIS